MNFRELLGKKIVFFDGAMGSMLQNDLNGALPETLNLSKPELIIDIHKKYISSGADIITTNTFGAYETKHKNYMEVIKAGINCARTAIRESGRDCLIAFDMGPTGKFIKPTGDLSFEESYNIFKKSAMIGEAEGADLIIIETMFDIYEIKAAVLAAKENTNLPVICSMTFDKAGRLISGSDVRVASAVLEGLNVDAIGINCGFGPEQIKKIQSELIKVTTKPILIQPNAGLPQTVGGKLFYDVTPKIFAKEMLEITKNGAMLLGGCCGTTPEHIKEMKSLCDLPINDVQSVSRNNFIACSYSTSVDVSKEQLVYGNTLNEDENPNVMKALAEQDIDFFVNSALEDADEEVDIINLKLDTANGFLPEIISAIQEFTGIPLSIESNFPENLEPALRIYNGKIALKMKSTDKKDILQALADKYGVVIV